MTHMKPRIRRIVEALRAYEPERIYLFGSWARGQADELSDVDLVVIKTTEVPFLARLQEAAAFIPFDAGAVDLLVYTPDEFAAMQREGNAFAEMIAEEAIVIYGRQAQN
jgi:predicted nucleotidyltransferase